jgi:4-hydroxy-3-polyprenylbenzoate decarboxylase
MTKKNMIAYRDLREWLDQVGPIGELKSIKGAHLDLEIGALTRLFLEKKDAPALLFEEIKDCSSGYRLLVNPLNSQKRLAITLGMSLDLKPLELVRAWKERINEIRPIPPKMVDRGPVMENVLTGNQIDIQKFPAPKWNEGDGGRYLGTGNVVITRDPEQGWVNLGTYRIMVHDGQTLAFYISPGKHGRIHREKCFARGEPCKVAVSFGHDPLYYLAGSLEVPHGVSEYDYIGGVRREPVEVIEGPVTGLPIPAQAELVIEGESPPDERRMEGPFGEFLGYYGRKPADEPIIRVKAVYHRNDPIIMAHPPTRIFSDNLYARFFLRPALIWNDLERAGVPDVKGVWYLAPGGENAIVVVAIRQRYHGHAKEAGYVATMCHSGSYLGRYTIVVDDDIDITNTDDVLWALGTRSDPKQSIEVIQRCWSTPLDPMVAPGAEPFNSRAVIDACKPFERRETFPEELKLSPELREKTKKTWAHILGE